MANKLKINLNFSLKRLDLMIKSQANTQFLGNYASTFKGQGLEFYGYRPYFSGVDDSSMIDWKASKRTNELLVKEFAEERAIEVVFLIDVSSQMLTGSTPKLKAEYIAEFVSALSHHMLKEGDSVGIILFSNEIKKFIIPDSGMKQFYKLTDSLVEVSNYGGYSNLDISLDFILNSVIHPGSIVFLISDFIYDIEDTPKLRLSSKKFDLICVMVKDPTDLELPEGSGQVMLQDPYSQRNILINPSKIKDFYKQHALASIERTRKLMSGVGVDILYLKTDEPFMKPLIEFFKMRVERWR